MNAPAETVWQYWRSVLILPLSGGHVSERAHIRLDAVLLRWQRGGGSGGAGRGGGGSEVAGGVAQRRVECPSAADRLHPLLHQPAQLHGPLHRRRYDTAWYRDWRRVQVDNTQSLLFYIWLIKSLIRTFVLFCTKHIYFSGNFEIFWHYGPLKNNEDPF